MYDYAWDFDEGLACVCIGEKGSNKYGYIGRQGNIVIPLIYDSPADFIDGIAYVKKNGKHGTINSDGKELVPIIYDSVSFMFSENKGLSRVKFQGRFGFVRCNGDVVIPMIYDEAGNFKDGRAEVHIEGEKFYIDVNGLKL